MLNKIVRYFILISIVAGLLTTFGNSNIAQTKAAVPAEFDKTEILNGLQEPTAFRFLPDGRVLIAEKAGAIKVFSNGVLQSEPVIVLTTLPTDNTDERGLLGIEPDPDYQTNGYLYVSYTTPQNHDRLSRITVVDNHADQNSEVVFAESDQDGRIYHHGGEVRFGPDGKLYWAMGMNGINPNSQDLTNIHGKLHRFNADGTIPTDNPYYNHPTAIKSIWATGLRNPFRFDFLTNGKPIVGDVGGGSWEEVNIIEKGANYGWPNLEGSCTDCPYVNPIFSYPHTPPPSDAGSITAAAQYTGNDFPTQYNNAFFYGDYTLGFIRYLKFDENYESVISDNLFDAEAGTVVQLSVGPDGNLYQMNIYPGVIIKISPSGGNRAPTAVAVADKVADLSPLTVNFSSAGSTDPDGQTLSYAWDFKDGNSSTMPNPTHTFTTDGTYSVSLTVSDGSKSAVTSVQITVGNRLPVATITTPTNTDKYNAGQLISYSGVGTDPEDGELPPSAFSWRFIFRHNEHTHPFMTVVNNTKTGSFTIPQGADNVYNTWYEIELTVTDSQGLKHKNSVEIRPNLVNLTVRTNPNSFQFTVDGIPHTGSFSEQAVVGVQRVISVQSPQYTNGNPFIFTNWSDDKEQTHTIITPGSDSILEATLIPQPEAPPAPWVSKDVGNTAVAGISGYEGGVYTLRGSGGDVWGPTDEFHYLYQTLTGDGEIVARVLSQSNTDSWAKSGVMIKSTAQPNSPYAMMAVTPGNGLNFQYNFNGQQQSGPFDFPVWLKLRRSGDQINAYYSTDGNNWIEGGSTNLAMNEPVTFGLFVMAHNQGTLNTTTFDNVTVKKTLPLPWANTDIGATQLSGSAEISDGLWTINGSGNDIWGLVDQFNFSYQDLSGDGEIVARMRDITSNTDGWAKAGIMIKESISTGSKYALIGITPANGYAFQYSNFGNTNGAAYTAANGWVKLKRMGNQISAYLSSDGVTWSLYGTTTLELPNTVKVGLFITAHNGSALATAHVSDVLVTTNTTTPTLPSPWTTTVIGSHPQVGEAAYSNSTFTISSGGDDVWGTTEQFRYVHQPLIGNGEISARITSQTGSSDWAKAGVMIRESTEAGAPYAFVGTTPQNGYVMQYSNFGHISGGVYTFPQAWVKLVRSGNQISTFKSIDGVNWDQIGVTSLNLTANAQIGLFVTAHDASLSTVTFENVSLVSTANELPAGWSQLKIGNQGLAGSATYADGLFTIKGSGNDVWGTTQQFYYAYQSLDGDGEISARITSQTGSSDWAKAGVMIKEAADDVSPFLFVGITPTNGYAMQHSDLGHISGGSYTLPNAWVKLVRSGDTITAFKSADGNNWVEIGNKALNMATSITFGLFVTAHDGSQISTVEFTNVTVLP